MTVDYYYKTVTDPVHGTIGLSKIETEVVSSLAFQRLQNVRQLGLAQLVFPGANYSRFAHSLGACRNAGLILEAIERNSGMKIDAERVQAFRLAALLHDLGHYPFSHATEHLVLDYYTDNDILEAIDTPPTSGTVAQAAPLPELPPAYDHEILGKVVIDNDKGLSVVFKDNGFNREDVKRIFGKTDIDNLVGIISSDLDCDRLDYLLRTAHFSGAPYGGVDINYLISQATQDREGRLCFTPKALRAADHLLVSRYYDYMHLPYHKTVAAFEWSLVSALRALLDRGELDCSAAKLQQDIVDGGWAQFDDQLIIAKLRQLQRSIAGSIHDDDQLLRDHLCAVLERKPAKAVIGWEAIADKDSKDHRALAKLIEAEAPRVANAVGVDPRRLHVWKQVLPLTKIDGNSKRKHLSDYELATSVHIEDRTKPEPELLVTRSDTLIHQLANKRYSGLRVYLLPQKGHVDPAVRKSLKAEFAKLAT